MRNLILSALILASAFQTAMGEQDGDWTYSVSNNEATITGYTGAGGAVTIPSSMNGIMVTSIGDNAFKGCTSLTTVTIITGRGSFQSIGLGAFSDCTSLTSIWANGVRSIGFGAFKGCNNLTSIFNSGLRSIGDYAFEGCRSLTIAEFVHWNIDSTGYLSSLTSIGVGAFTGCASLANFLIPNSVTSIGGSAFQGCTGLSTITIPNSVIHIGTDVFRGTSIPSTAIPERFLSQIGQIGLPPQDATNYLVNTLANNDAFVTAVANKIKATSGNYGIATQSGLSTAITTAVEPLATKTELTSSLDQSRTDGINSVLSNPNLWTLYTTSQIQNMAVGDLVLTRQVSGGFVLNYDIEQSTDLQTWTTYAPLSLPLTGLPTDKAFVRIKAK